MRKESQEELKYAKQLKEQQRALDKNDNPRERDRLAKLKGLLEKAKAERKAASAHSKPREPPKPVSTTTPSIETSSASTKPTPREVNVTKAQTRVEHVSKLATKA